MEYLYGLSYKLWSVFEVIIDISKPSQSIMIAQFSAWTFADSLRDDARFSILVKSFTYWQVSIAEEDHNKIIFTYPSRIYRFMQRSFGSTNAPTSSANARHILIGFTWYTCLVNFSDVIVFYKFFDNHWFDINSVLFMIWRWDQVLFLIIWCASLARLNPWIILFVLKCWQLRMRE